MVQLKRDGVESDFSYPVKGLCNETFLVYFIVDRQNEIKASEIMYETVRDGFKEVFIFLASDEAEAIEVRIAKMYYDRQLEKYKLHSIQYKDGTVKSFVPTLVSSRR